MFLCIIYNLHIPSVISLPACQILHALPRQFSINFVFESSAAVSYYYSSTPTYQDKYTDRIDECLNGILNRGDFSCNALMDNIDSQVRNLGLLEQMSST